MAKQTFTTGQVLTAAQMTSLQQTAMLGGSASAKTASYTLVAADAGTAISMSNASATTITVNTALFAAGDTVQITNLGAGVCTITAGTATVNTSASLALAQYESGTLNFTSTSAAIFIKGAGASASASGLTLIRNTSFSSVSSVSLAANTFTSTYTNYKVIVDITSFSITGTFGARLRAGSTDAATNYQNTRLFGTGGGTVTADTPAATSYSLGSVDSNTNFIAELTLFKPNVAIKKWMLADYFAYNGSWDRAIVGARLDDATQFDSITFLNSSGNITGRVYVYGYSI